MEKITLKNGTNIIIRECLGGWEATTEENYNAPISNAREVMKFNKDFENLEQVKEYLMGL